VTAPVAGTPGSDVSPLAPEPRHSGAPSARARALLWIEDGGGLAPDVPAGALARLRAEAAAAAARIAARPLEEDLG
jgi:hypothetical protein